MDETELASLMAQAIDAVTDDARAQWAEPQGTRTRHFFVDDLLPADLAAQVQAAFPRDAEIWHHRRSFREHKLTCTRLAAVDPLIRATSSAFQQPAVLEAVRRITGLDGLQADPTLYASGLSMMARGHFLNPHIDNSHDGRRERYRRLNLLYYVSPDWSAASGGNFELWDAAVRRPVEIVSRFNRLLVMETRPDTWHSVNPVRGAAPRCCVSNYYFSSQSPTGSDYYHVTSFLGRPGQPLRRLLGRLDNGSRQAVARITGAGRGRRLLNDA
ncbi:MAG: 2OG-Fe(II) oxygenase [Burkholderiaceae bacterium]